MDMGLLRGIVTAVLFVLFLALIAWAWSGRRRELFERMAKMPLEEDESLREANRDRGSAKL
jgi:cytochrome c oxidase cbb3-type subunit IV